MEGALNQSTLDVGVRLRRNWVLSPSDFAFLFDECQRCYYLKHVHGFGRPQLPFPRVFGQIDAHMKQALAGTNIRDLFPECPPGYFQRSSGAVESKPIEFPACNTTCSIQGSYDALVKLNEGGYLVIDYKTTLGAEKMAFRYARQLHAYAWALERAIPKADHATPVKALGLMLFRPGSFQVRGREADYRGELKFVPIQRDDQAFGGLLHRIVRLLEADEPPTPAPSCVWCNYRQTVRKFPF